MQFSSIFMLGMASFVVAAPNPQATELPGVIGWTWNGPNRGVSLSTNGGCIKGIKNKQNGADYERGIRCRFYRGTWCDPAGRIGGQEGLPGKGRDVKMPIEPFGAVTCWRG